MSDTDVRHDQAPPAIAVEDQVVERVGKYALPCAVCDEQTAECTESVLASAVGS